MHKHIFSSATFYFPTQERSVFCKVTAVETPQLRSRFFQRLWQLDPRSAVQQPGDGARALLVPVGDGNRTEAEHRS